MSSFQSTVSASAHAQQQTAQPAQIVLAGLLFRFASPVVLTRTADGFLEYQPHTRYKRFGEEPLNRYGQGPFCKFTVSGLPTGPGLYAFVIAGLAMYVGKTEDFRNRMGRRNYSSIAPAKCYRHGQATNCKINGGVLIAAKAGLEVAVYVHPTTSLGLEDMVIAAVRPPWNGPQVDGIRLPSA
jgi:hypothetical protein